MNSTSVASAPMPTKQAMAQANVSPDEPMQYLTFLLGGEEFGIGILAIKEIIEYHTLTTVPMMPAYVFGVINLRGAVVPVMDLSVRFGRAPTQAGKRTCIVIVEVQFHGTSQVIGVVVDIVNEVLHIPSSDIEPAPSIGNRIRPELIAGMGKVKGKFVILLDVNSIMSSVEMASIVHAGSHSRLDLTAPLLN